MGYIFSNTTKIVKTLPFLLSGCCLPLFAANQGEGAVLIQGAVLYTPCAIDLGSRDQTIDMGDTPVSEIATKGYGPTRAFTVRLINCLMLPTPGNGRYDSEYYQITFEPMTGADRFSVRGDAQGINPGDPRYRRQYRRARRGLSRQRGHGGQHEPELFASACQQRTAAQSRGLPVSDPLQNGLQLR